MKQGTTRAAVVSLVPIVVLVGLMTLSISFFGGDSILGASQVTLIISSMVCVGLAMWLFKTPWENFENAIRKNIGDITTAIIILFLIGAISGTWTMSGAVPALIYYGVRIISPKVFLLTACVICAIVSLMIGSSWTTVATMGVALLGIGKALGFSDGIIAGAIISGAYFGDKISPLSDTTIMASSVSGTPLFTHIRYMMYTTVPSFAICLVIFTVIGLTSTSSDTAQISVYTSTLSAKFHITPWTLLVPAFTVLMIARRMPALAVLSLSMIMAAVAALILQADIIREIGTDTLGALGISQGQGLLGGRWSEMFTGILRTIYDKVSVNTGVPEVDRLVTSRGMSGMMNTVFLIITAMCFGGCLKGSGMLANIAGLILPLSKTRAGLVGSTLGSGFVLNGLVSDQYLTIILTSDMFKDVYKEQGYESRLLSRSVEDSGTVMSVLFPWNSCGMTQSTVLGVATLAYVPYCFFNLISPLMSLTVALLGFKIFRHTEVTDKPKQMTS